MCERGGEGGDFVETISHLQYHLYLKRKKDRGGLGQGKESCCVCVFGMKKKERTVGGKNKKTAVSWCTVNHRGRMSLSY